MTTVSKKIKTNTRVIKDLLTKYSDTFKAFKELINNSLQASAKNIEIKIDYTNDIKSKSGINNIIIKDDGIGVCYSDFDKKILEIGTNVKDKGQGIGRFSALQIGELMHIETVAFDKKVNQYTKTNFSLDTTDLKEIELEETELKVDFENLGNEQVKSYYLVEIQNLYHNKQDKCLKKNSIHNCFLSENIKQSIFEHYPYEIFNDSVAFYINDEKILREDFILNKPSRKEVEYIDIKGSKKTLIFYFFNIKSNLNKVKVFFRIENAGIKSVAHEFTYSSDWYTPDLGTWFIYVESSFFSSDLFRNLDLEALGDEEIKNIKASVKDTINNFFKARNKRFDKFLDKLENDLSYPYKNNSPFSETQEIVFKKVAYLIENEYKLIEKDNKIREFLYPLLDKAILNGNIEYIFNKILNLSDESLEKFKCLLEKTNLEDVVHFVSQVSTKLEFLDFLHELIYGEISKHLKERTQLHKIIEKELWLFGENYNGSPKLWSDKKIGNILDELRKNHFCYIPTKEDDNLIEVEGGLDDITDLFFYNEKITDNNEREIMVVELKSPKCAISDKEISQIDRYAFKIEDYASLPSDKVKYKLILISSRLTKFAKSKLNSRRESFRDIPFLYDKKTGKNIEIYVMEWSELIEHNKRKLGYLSQQLNVKDKSVKEKFEKEYPELIDEKINAQLRRVK